MIGVLVLGFREGRKRNFRALEKMAGNNQVGRGCEIISQKTTV